MSEAADFDVAIIGGGPAAQAAAAVIMPYGLSVAILDEQARLGGQILRQPPAGISVPNWLPGRQYAGLKRQLRDAEASPITQMMRTSALGLMADEDGEGWVLRVASETGAGRLKARWVLVATGCYDLPVALPGWTLPGVMTAGAVQAFLKSQQVAPGSRFVFAGSHPLQLIVAAQALEAGADVAAVLFSQPRRSAFSLLRRLPTVAVSASQFSLASKALARLIRGGVRVKFNRTVTEVAGADRVERVSVASIQDGGLGPVMEEIACDRVALCFGFLPQSDIARAAGAAFEWSPPAGGWSVQHDEWMQSSLEGLFVAGEVTGVAGAEVSLLEGRLAGVGLLLAAGVLKKAEAERLSFRTRAALRRARSFAALLRSLAAPGSLIDQLARNETLICRCEDVSKAEILAAGASLSPNAAKLISRAGMGLCQGRTCEAALVRAAAQRDGRSPRPSDAFTSRFPARPVTIEELLRGRLQKTQ